MKEIAEVHKHSILRLTKEGKDPKGNPLPALSRRGEPSYAEFKFEHVGNDDPDLRLGFDENGNKKPRAFDGFNADFSDGEIEFDFDYQPANTYMFEHDAGEKGQARRWQPKDTDANTDPQKQVTEKVRVILAKYFNR